MIDELLKLIYKDFAKKILLFVFSVAVGSGLGYIAVKYGITGKELLP